MFPREKQMSLHQTIPTPLIPNQYIRTFSYQYS